MIPSFRPPLIHGSELAAHFMECGEMNVGLSLSKGGRFVITDDLLNGTINDITATSVAAIVARDSQIASAAIISLGFATCRAATRRRRDRFERLLELIEQQAYADVVRDSIDMIVSSNFRETRITELIHELGGAITPARHRYQAFLGIIRMMEAKKISENLFIEEFINFTSAVAGKLDFGIFAICVERMFLNKNISIDIKIILFQQILGYPPLVRKELISSFLHLPEAPAPLLHFAHESMTKNLPHETRKEILLVTLLKRSWYMQRANRAKDSTLIGDH